jgi:hypothetical protein
LRKSIGQVDALGAKKKIVKNRVKHLSDLGQAAAELTAGAS